MMKTNNYDKNSLIVVLLDKIYKVLINFVLFCFFYFMYFNVQTRSDRKKIEINSDVL